MTNQNAKISIEENVFPNKYFSTLEDPGRTNKGHFYYPLDEILFLVISAVVSGYQDWTSIQIFGNAKLDWLRRFFPYQHGIPSHDVIGKLFIRLDPIRFNECFIKWVNSLSELTNGEVVSIPEILDLLSVQGCVVTIDAMGCQKEIASKIMEKKAGYVLMVKDNQKELKTQVAKMFSLQNDCEKNVTIDAGHGRIENRLCKVIDNLTFMDDVEQCMGLKSVVQVTSKRCVKKTGATAEEARYYISSLNASAARMNQIVRSHWSVENNLHWVLDVVFNEDSSLKKKYNSAVNFNIVTKVALSLLEKEQTMKASKKGKRENAALDDRYREKVLKCKKRFPCESR